MRTILSIIILTLLSCNRQAEKTNQSIVTDTTQEVPETEESATPEYGATNEMVRIVIEPEDTLEYSQAGFNQIIDDHPEFFDDYPLYPDEAYACNAGAMFGSEAGQDGYYALYAHFLKQKNGVAQYARQRTKLIDIYRNINALFASFQYGGTYFGHQHSRILGYAEYSVWLYSKNMGDIEKTYDITKQKELYIRSLRQLIEDESKIDAEAIGNKKTERTKEQNKIVSNLEKLITENFYLRRAQEFQYGHYEYY
jgi:hypothetical protein